MRKLIFFGVVMAVFIIAVFVRISSINAEDQNKREGIDAIHEREGYPVKSVPIKTGLFEVWRDIQGQVKGSQHAHIRTPDPAKVKEIKYKIGDIVPADTPIILLDKDDPKQMTKVNLLREVYNDAKKDYEKYKRLNQQGAIPAGAVDKMKLNMDAAKTNLDSALTTVEVTSPVTGILTHLNIRVGEVADPNADICVVSSMEKVRVTAAVSDRDTKEVAYGQKVKVLSGDKVLEGTVDRLALGAAPTSGLFDMEMLVDNPDMLLRNYTYVTAKVRIFEKEDGQSVSSNAIMLDSDGSQYVYQIKDGKAKKTLVTLTAQNDDYSLVEGLDPSLSVVVDGHQQLKDGVKVLLINDMKSKAKKAEAEGSK